MSDLRLEFKGADLSLTTADAVDVLPVLAAYLEAVRVVAVTQTGGEGSVAFALPRWYEGSAGAACIIREGADLVRSASETIVRSLSTPNAAPRGARSVVTELRDCLQALPEDVSVLVNGVLNQVDITAIARGASHVLAKSREMIRARVERTGGTGRPSVRFRSTTDESFTLRATATLAKEAGQVLFETVDIEAEVDRALDLDGAPIMSGRLIELRRVSEGPSLDDLRAWYRQTHPEGVAIDEHE